MTHTLEDVLTAVAAAGLPGSLRELPQRELPEPLASELVAAAQRQELSGLLLTSALREGLVLPSAATTSLEEAHLAEMATCLRLEHELLSVAGLLDEATIQFWVLGAPAVAHLQYRDPAMRPFHRLDLLVGPEVLRDASALLRRNGWQEPPLEIGAPVGRTTLAGPTGLRLDLHDTVATSAEADVQVTEVWGEGRQFRIGGRVLQALADEQRLLHTCWLVLAESPSSLVAHRDLAEMVLFGDWLHPRLMQLAKAWNAQGVLARAVTSVWRRFALADVTALSVWAAGQESRQPEPDTARTVTPSRLWARNRTPRVRQQ